MNIKVTLIAFLIAGSWAIVDPSVDAGPEPVTESSVVDDLNQIRKDIENDKLQAEYDSEYEKFQDELSDLINTHNNNTKTTKVGDYQIIVQTDCSFDMDIKPPVLTPFEKDCYSAKAAADASAEMIINTAPNNPPSIEFVQSAVTDCKMTLSVSKSFTIHNLCYVEEFAAEYKAILDDYQSKLHAAGFTTRKDNDDGSTTFSSDTVHKSIDLEKHLGQNIDPETFNISAVPELS